MNIFDELVNKVHKIYNFIKSVFVKKYIDLKKWYVNYENKKSLYIAIISWVVTFAVVIGACRIVNYNKINVDATETTIIENDSSYETTEKKKEVVNETNPVTIEETTTQQITTEEVTTQVKKEIETVDVSKLSVSSTPIADDVESTSSKLSSISSADIKTISSSTYDSSQFSYGIDISYHQGKIDWAKVKASGVEYAFIRVGNRGYETGKLCKDARFDENIQGAINNGIKVGVYFFSQAITEQEALEEASLTLSYIRKYNITLPVVIDWETDNGYRTYSGLSKTKLTNIISTFCNTISNYGYEPMVYMCKSDFVSRINTTEITSRYKTWVAWYFKEYSTNDYPSNLFKFGDLMPDMTFDYYMWQYSSKGRIGGIKELVDMNIMIMPKIIYDLKLNTTKNSFVVNLGSSTNLFEGVSAVDSSGNDATSKITMSITNSDNKQVTKENAFKTSGIYTISYEYSESSTNKVIKQAKLYVRNYPEVYFENILWSDDKTRTVNYEYNNNLSVTENYNKIIELLESKINSYYYDTVSGNSSKVVVKGEFKNINNIIVDNNINASNINISYYVVDNKGLNITKNIELIINKNEIVTEETTNQTENTTDEYIS